jgi:vacuolar-type H+-ATPase subunit H
VPQRGMSEPSSATGAMERVLVAEASAREGIAASEAEAARRIEAARSRARRIRRRATERIVALQRARVAATDATILEMRRTALATAVTEDLDVEDRRALRAAAVALARELVGGDDA